MKRPLRYTCTVLICLVMSMAIFSTFHARKRDAIQRKSIAQLAASGANVRMALESRSSLAKKLWWLPWYTPVGDVQAGDTPNFGDAQLAPVLALPEITRLELQNTSVTDQGVKRLAETEMPNLRSINLSGTSLSGDGLLALASLPELTDISVSRCDRLTAADVQKFRKKCKHFVRLHGLR